MQLQARKGPSGWRIWQNRSSTLCFLWQKAGNPGYCRVSGRMHSAASMHGTMLEMPETGYAPAAGTARPEGRAQPVLRTAGQSFSKQRFDSKKQHNDNADAQVAGKKTNGKTSHVSFLLFWNFQQAACAANQFPGWRGCHHPDRRLPSPSGCCCKSVPKRNGFPG